MKHSIRIGLIIKILGRLLLIESLLMVLPLIVCLIYAEDDWIGFAIAVISAAMTGGLVELSSRRFSSAIHGREGFIITALVWWIFGIFGMIPFMLCENSLCFTDAMFEVISGFTTTGASMITNVEIYSHGILFWRAFTQWIGGLGIIFFMLAVLPELNKPVGISMFNAEATGITHSKLHPRIRQTALSIWGIYVVLTIMSILLLWAGPMNLFDSICQTFAAVATGGFSTKNEGIIYWNSDYILVATTIIMFIAGINFMLLYSAWKNGWKDLVRNDVLKAFTLIVILSYSLFVLSAVLQGETKSIDRILIYPLFHIISAITSTGFSIGDVENWGQFSLFMTILLMLCGACSGSTSGGLKVDRLIVLYRNFLNEIKKTVFPKRIYVVTLNGSSLQSSLVGRVSAFVSLYFLTIILSTAAIILFGYSLTDSLFMVISCIGCNGLGYGVTGIEGSFALLPQFVKWLLVIVMLIGRLELFTFLVLLLPSFWKR